jgi:hypothetical protein
MADPKQSEHEKYDAVETERRFKDALKRMLSTPRTPHAETRQPRKKKAPSRAKAATKKGRKPNATL